MPVNAPPQSDAQLIQASKAGDKEAFAVLMARHGHYVSTYLHQVIPHAADDVGSMVWTDAWTRIASFDASLGSPFRHWLRRIARNRMVDWRRKEKTFVIPIDEVPERKISAASDAPETEVLVREVIAFFHSNAHPDTRMIFYSRLEDIPWARIAEALRITTNQARYRFMQARALMADYLDRRGRHDTK